MRRWMVGRYFGREDKAAAQAIGEVIYQAGSRPANLTNSFFGPTL